MSDGRGTRRAPWTCHAKPAERAGATCGHVNADGGTRFNGITCCGGCGATFFASEARREKEAQRGRRA